MPRSSIVLLFLLACDFPASRQKTPEQYRQEYERAKKRTSEVMKLPGVSPDTPESIAPFGRAYEAEMNALEALIVNANGEWFKVCVEKYKTFESDEATRRGTLPICAAQTWKEYEAAERRWRRPPPEQPAD